MSKPEDNDRAVEKLLQEAGNQFRSDFEQADLAEHQRETLSSAVRAQREIGDATWLERITEWLALVGGSRVTAGLVTGFACVLVGWFLPQFILPTGEQGSGYGSAQLSLVIEFEDLEYAESDIDSEQGLSDSEFSTDAESVSFGGFDPGYEALVITTEDLEDNGVLEDDEEETYST